MLIEPGKAPNKNAEHDFEQKLRDMNEELMVSAVRQHELIEQLEIAEKALSFLGLVIASSQQSFVTTDFDGIITTWNTAAEELYGYTAAEAVGKPLAMLALPEDIKQLLAKIEAIRNGQTVQIFDTVRIVKGGFEISLEILLSPVSDHEGRVIGVATIARDITVRIKADADRERMALEARERKALELETSRKNENRLAESQMRLAIELAATQQLQEVSTSLIAEDDPQALYEQILDAAMAIMRSQFASLQMYQPDHGGGELRLLGHRGFSPEAAKFWHWVRPASKSTCGVALVTGQRVVVENVEGCEWMSGSEDLATLLNAGINAVQTTPLVSRSGVVLGMISTHWQRPHLASERDFRLLDVLARQAADLIERSQANEDLRRSEVRYRAIVESQSEMVCRFHPDGQVFFVNQAYANALGATAESLTGSIFWDIVKPEDRPHVAEMLAQITPETPDVRIENRLETVEGVRWSLWTNRGLAFDADGRATEVQSAGIDITESKNAETLVETQKQALEMVVGDHSLTEVLEFLVEIVEERGDGSAVAAIVLLDKDGHLHNAASRSLPQAYLDAIDGIAADVNIGTCSAAAATSKTVITPDIDASPQWASFKHLPLGLGLVAAWSMPITAADGKVLGTFGTYFREKRGPTEFETKTVEILTKTAALAIERRRSEENLIRLADRNREILESITDGFFSLDGEWRFTDVNQQAELIIDRKAADLVGKTIWDAVPEIAGSEFESAYRRTADERIVSTITSYSSDRDAWYEVNVYPAPNGITVYFRNVTEREKAAEVLRRTEEQYRTLFNSIDEGFCILEMIFDLEKPVDYRFLELNPVFEKMTGLSADAVMSGKTARELVPNLEDKWVEIYGRVAVTGESIRFTEGSEAMGRWFDVYACHVGGPESRKVALSFSDITEPRRVAQALSESEEKFRMLSEAAPALIWFDDAEGQCRYTNQYALTFTGKTAEEFIGQGWQLILHPEDSESYLSDFKAAQREQRPFYHRTRAQRHDGKWRWIESFGRPLFGADGAYLGHVGISPDITPSVEAEQALRKSEERLRLTMESVTDYAIITTDVDGVIDGWNPGAEAIFGFDESEIIGRSAELLFTAVDRKNKVPETEMKQALTKGRAQDERWHLRKDGSRFFASGVMTPLEDGGTIGFVKIARDETLKMRAEAAINQREMLRRLVQSQEAERQRMAREIHDQLGQTVTALRLKVAALREHCNSDELREGIAFVEAIGESLDSEVGTLAWEFRPAVLDDLGLEAALKNYLGRWSKQFEIAAEFHTGGLNERRLDPEIETNLYRITQEALNNVGKHAKASTANVLLEVRQKHIVLIIEDDGIGFDPAEVRVGNESVHGLGVIGMRERAALIGGTIEIESAKSEGTTIFVRIPAKFAPGVKR